MTNKLKLPKINIKNTPTKIGFAENQLSLSLISLSPLNNIIFRILQHSRIRSSNYLIFNLILLRSLSFG